MALQTHSASIAARIGKGIDVLSALLVLSFFPAFEACAQSSAGGQASTTAALIGASNAAGAGTNVPQTVGVETAGQPNAKALACLAAGRAILQRTSPDLNAALVQFNAAVTADSSNAQVRIVRALARVAAVSQYPAIQTLLNRFGFSAEGRDLWNWTSHRTGEMAVDLRSKEVLDQLAGPVADALSQADLDLAVVTQRDFLTVFANADWQFGDDIFVDYGDVTMLRAFLKGAVSAIQLLTSQNADVGICNLKAAIEEGRATVHGLLQAYPSLLTVQDAVKARSAVGVFQAGASLYTDGLAALNARQNNGGLNYLLVLDEGSRREAVALQATLQEVSRSLKDGVVVHLTDPGNPNPGIQLHANAALFVGRFATGWRAALPAFSPGSNHVESRLAQGVFADPQLGGMLPELSRDDWRESLLEPADYIDEWLAKSLKRMPQNVAAGAETTFLVKEDGSLWAWGDNSRGRLGEPKITVGSKSLPVRIGAASDWRSVVASYHTLALKWDGTLFAWGQNSGGQLGDGTLTDRSAPVQIGAMGEWKTVSAGANYSAGIKKNGSLWMWGSGASNLIGGMSGAPSPQSLVRVGSDIDWESVSAGSWAGATLALKKDGSLYQFSAGTPVLIAAPWGTSGWATVAQGWSSRHWLGIAKDGSLWASGANDFGQLGTWYYYGINGPWSNGSGDQPTRVGMDNDWLGVIVGGDHSVACKRNGSASIWGSGGSHLAQSYPSAIPEKLEQDGWVAGSLSQTHAVGVHKDGSVWTSGDNGSGQLGNGTQADASELQPVASVYTATPPVQFLSQLADADLMPGQPLVLSVRANGAGLLTYQWRKNGVSIAGATGPSYVIKTASAGDAANYDVLVSDSTGASVLSAVSTVAPRVVLGIKQHPLSKSVASGGSVTFSVVAEGAGPFTYQWRKDGQAIPEANDSSYNTIGSYNATYDVIVGDASGSVTSSIASLSISGTSSLGTVYVRNQGYLGSDIFKTSYAAGIGDPVTLAVDVLGSSSLSYKWTRTSSGTATVVIVTTQPTLSIGSMQLADAGTYSVSVVTGGGTLNCTANLALSTSGQTLNVLPSSTTPAINAGDSATWLLKADGSLWAWGWNVYGQLGDGTQVDRALPVQISPAGTWRSISARGTHVLAIKPNGTLWSWGRNDHGQLGSGTTNDRWTPAQVGTATTWVAAQARGSWSAALKSDGTLWTWGGNAYGQLGQGGTLDTNTPTQVGGAKDWAFVEPGINHVFARKADGTWHSWGRNDFGQLGDGSTVNRRVPGRLSAEVSGGITAVAVGETFTLEQKADGSLLAVGDNRAGQFSNGTYDSSARWASAGAWAGGQSGSIAAKNLSALGATVMALSNWGSLFAWGSNAYHQIYDGALFAHNYPLGVFYPSWGSGPVLSAVSVGINHATAMDSDGNIYTWGRDNHGQLGDGTNLNGDHAMRTVTSLRAMLTPQSISFSAPDYQTQNGAPFQLQARVSSGTSASSLAVGYRVVSGASLLSVSSNGLVTLKTGTYGTAIIAAFQQGDSTHAAANEVTRAITVLKASAARPVNLSSSGTAKMDAGRIAFLNHDLAGAIAAFNAVVSSDPSNARARVLRALARAFSLLNGSEAQKLLDRAGISPGGRDLWNWQAEPTNHFATGFNTSEFFDFLGGTAVSNLKDIVSDLALADASFLMDIPDVDWQLGQDYVMDYADTLLLQAFAKGVIASLYMGTTPNFDLDVNASLQSSISTFQALLAANPNLLTAKNATRPSEAVSALRQGVALYESALAAVALRSGNPDGDARIFDYVPNDVTEATGLLDSFKTVLAAYDRSVALAQNKSGDLVAVDTAASGSIEGTAARVNPSALVNELTAGLRRNLPIYSGNYPVQGTMTGLLGSPRLNGAVVAPEWNSTNLGDFFETAGGYLTKFFSSRVKLGVRFGFTEGFDGALALPVGQPLALQAVTKQAAGYEGVALIYQWFKDGLPQGAPVHSLDGASASYVVPSVALADGGDYSLRATDSFSHEAWTGPIRVSVVSGVTTSAPTVVLNPGQGANLSVGGVTGATYQWRKNGQDIPNATGSSYAVGSVQPSDLYTVVVTGSADGIATTYPFFLNVNKPVAFTSQPSSINVLQSGSATFSVSVTGTEPFSYQWRKDGLNVAGATSVSFAITSAGTASAGTYSVTVTNSAGPVTSAGAVLSVTSPAGIKTAPQNVAANPGTNATFSVDVSGTGPFTYTWKNASYNTQILGATTSTLTLKNITAADAGLYQVEVNNPFGSPIRAAGMLAVNTPVTFTAQPVGGGYSLGTPVNLSVSVSGTPPFKYQWRKDGVALTGGTAAAYVVNAGTEATSGVYDVQVSNPVGTLSSGTATVAIHIPATIVKQPMNVVSQAGGTVVLAVGAKGTGVLEYQWSKSGSVISGGTNGSLKLSSLSTQSAGSYTVRVQNAYGSVTSNPVLVSVVSAAGVAILKQPVDITIIRGSSVFESVAVDAPVETGVATFCQLYTADLFGNGSQAVGNPVGVPENGVLSLSLRNVTFSGDYILRFSRRLNDGTMLVSDSQPFHVFVRTWDEAAGAYAGLLQDVNGVVGDGAAYRGLLSAAVTRTGYLSGRLQYVEAQPIPSAGSLGYKAYVPVILSFTGNLTPVADEPLKFRCTPKLGASSQTGKEELILTLDFGAEPVAMSAVVKDKASVPTSVDPDGCLSEVISAPRLLNALASAYSGLVGRYVIAANTPANGGTADDNGYVLVQVLKTGGIFWTTRLTGFTATGSGILNVADAFVPTVQFFGYKSTLTPALLNSTVLAGQINFQKSDDLSWSASFGSDLNPGCIEKQSSYLAGGRTPIYSESLFNSGANYTGIKILSFTAGDGCRWSGATMSGLPAFLAGGKSMILSVRDPAVSTSGVNAVYSWNVALSTPGVTSVSGISRNGVSPPNLSLRLDKATGEWTGSYSATKLLRRNLVGSAFTSSGDPYLLGRGWVEVGTGVSLTSGAWTLQLAP